MAAPTLLLPVAGRSSRYPGMRPKWLLTHPRGTLMLTEAIRGLNPGAFERILVVALESHERDFRFSRPLREEMAEVHGVPLSRVEILLLKQETRSQPETIHEGLEMAGVEGAFLVKDSDNHFHLPALPAGNGVAVIDLHASPPLLVGNKSYACTRSDGTLEKIVEKQVVSHLFCCGGYFFQNAEDFHRAYFAVRDQGTLYPSSVIQWLLEQGVRFEAVPAAHFEDWGTLADWNAFKRKFATLFVELDGLVVLDSQRHFEPKWGTTEALRRNASVLRRIHDSGRVEIILLTSRSEGSARATEEQLRKNAIPYHRILYGLPTHCQRILAGACSEHNPYEAAHAINLRLNEDRLDECLHALLD